MDMKYITPAAFFAVVYWIYAFVRPEWCNFHEQYQMFLFGWDYLAGHLSIASGMADYLAEFVVQFFFFPALGAALWAAMLTGLGLLVWRASLALSGNVDSSGLHLALALVPSVLVGFYCGDYNMMLAFPMCLVMALLMFLLYQRLASRRRVYFQIFLIPLFYWLSGYGVFVYAALCAMADARRFWRGWLPGLALLSVYAAVSVLCVVMAGYTVMRQYPFIDLFCGVNFYRDRMVVPFMQHLSAFSVVLMPALIALLGRGGKAVQVVCGALVVSAIPVLMPFSHDKFSYSLMKIDYLVRNQRWKDVISFCQVYLPDDSMAYNGLNLALAKTGQLPDRMFEFPQMGQEGLVGDFQRNAVSCVITGEAFYHLGLINQVLRVFFDSQASIVNCNRSARFTHRIAESYLVTGRYDMAAKHIRMLEKTLFYSAWAREAAGYLYHPDKVAASSRWSQIARHRVQDYMLYTVTDMSDMFLRLHHQSPDNQLALQYAMACDLLNGNLPHFMRAFPLTQPGKNQVSQYSNVPKSYQEAVMYAMVTQSGGSVDLPPFVSQEVRNCFRDFDNMMTMRQQPDKRLFSTYWRYIVSYR